MFIRSFVFFFSSRRRHTRSLCDWSSDVCSSDLAAFGFRTMLGGGIGILRDESGSLRAAQAGAALEGIGFAGGEVAVVAAAVPQQAHAARQAEALAPGLQPVTVVALHVDQRAEAERGRALAEMPRRVNVVASV